MREYKHIQPGREVRVLNTRAKDREKKTDVWSPGSHLSKHRVLRLAKIAAPMIEEVVVDGVDEELRAAAVLLARVRHGERAGLCDQATDQPNDQARRLPFYTQNTGAPCLAILKNIQQENEFGPARTCEEIHPVVRTQSAFLLLGIPRRSRLSPDAGLSNKALSNRERECNITTKGANRASAECSLEV
jgi:hypothetical protein